MANLRALSNTIDEILIEADRLKSAVPHPERAVGELIRGAEAADRQSEGWLKVLARSADVTKRPAEGDGPRAERRQTP